MPKNVSQSFIAVMNLAQFRKFYRQIPLQGEKYYSNSVKEEPFESL